MQKSPSLTSEDGALFSEGPTADPHGTVALLLRTVSFSVMDGRLFQAAECRSSRLRQQRPARVASGAPSAALARPLRRESRKTFGAASAPTPATATILPSAVCRVVPRLTFAETVEISGREVGEKIDGADTTEATEAPEAPDSSPRSVTDATPRTLMDATPSSTLTDATPRTLTDAVLRKSQFLLDQLLSLDLPDEFALGKAVVAETVTAESDVSTATPTASRCSAQIGTLATTDVPTELASALAEFCRRFKAQQHDTDQQFVTTRQSMLHGSERAKRFSPDTCPDSPASTHLLSNSLNTSVSLLSSPCWLSDPPPDRPMLSPADKEQLLSELLEAFHASLSPRPSNPPVSARLQTGSAGILQVPRASWASTAQALPSWHLCVPQQQVLMLVAQPLVIASGGVARHYWQLPRRMIHWPLTMNSCRVHVAC